MPAAGTRKHDHARRQFYDDVGRAILDARNIAGITRVELAKRAGISADQLALIEQGVAECSLYLAARIAETLDLTLEDIARVTLDERAAG